ncbi:hypothetical protein CTI12_AA475520 [Artemisia annua]|uniref:Zinc knuckle CX2CX4HX4C n=1 Tax=Artemisia annua TaxID=35608 RepID=A0A2U1LMH5_ARTAN|nr:hypothetical protein CTI12_AA475520 [Artemisia annua]
MNGTIDDGDNSDKDGIYGGDVEMMMKNKENENVRSDSVNSVVHSNNKELKPSYANIAQDKGSYETNVENLLKVRPTEIDENASRCGKPLIMDVVTATNYKHGDGRLGYARVLVEIDASKELPKTNDVVYSNALNEVHCKKSVPVEYSWVPPKCSCKCEVFGHWSDNCNKNKKTDEINEHSNGQTGAHGTSEEMKNENGFTKVNYRKTIRK